MLIQNEERELILDINLTIREAYLLSVWMNFNIMYYGGTKLNFIENGCDMVDYYQTEIIFKNNEEKFKTIDYIRSLPQESNFGGIRENEYWIHWDDLKEYRNDV